MRYFYFLFFLLWLNPGIAFSQGDPRLTIAFGDLPVKNKYVVSEIDTVKQLRLIFRDGGHVNDLFISHGSLYMDGAPTYGIITENGFLDATCLAFLKQARQKRMVIQLHFINLSGSPDSCSKEFFIG